MNIDEMTIGDFKKLKSLFQNQPHRSGLSFPIGKYVIVRSRNEGVNFGKLIEADGTGCSLEEASRLWSHKGKHGYWYEGVSVSGLTEDSKRSVPTSKIIIEDYSITICSDSAVDDIKAHPTL